MCIRDSSNAANATNNSQWKYTSASTEARPEYAQLVEDVSKTEIPESSATIRWKQDNKENPVASISIIPMTVSYTHLDWQDEVFGSNPVAKYVDLSVNGGTDKAKYKISFIHQDQPSVIVGNGLKQNNMNEMCIRDRNYRGQR